MKKLHFQYKMDLTFSDHAREHHIVLKCRPMEQPGQTLTSFVCRTDPVSALCEVQDGFGNRCITGTIRESHDHFSVLAEGTVERTMQKETVFHPMYRFPSAYTRSVNRCAGLWKQCFRNRRDSHRCNRHSNLWNACRSAWFIHLA